MNISKKSAGLLIGLGLLAGTAVTLGVQANAQTTTTPSANRHLFDPAKGGHVGSNGIREELLTGDAADKVKAAALAAVPGGAIQRVETDAEGAVYEAHMLKADGSPVTVKFDASYNVTATETGGPGPMMRHTRTQ